MGEGRHEGRAEPARTEPARTYATVVGASLILLGLTGLFYSSSFARGDSLVAAKVFGLFYANGWQNVAYLVAGGIGLALAPILPRLYCFVSGVGWSVLAAGGFFGAHGGEMVPAMGGLIPAGTANNVLRLLLAGLAFWAFATGPKPLHKANPHRKSKPKLKPKTKAKAAPSGAGERRPIN